LARAPIDRRTRLAMSEVTTFNWSIDADIKGYGRHGFGGIEVWLNKAARRDVPYDELPAGRIPPEAVAALAGELLDARLEAVSVVCAGGLTEPDPERWRARIDHLAFAMDFAAALGAACVLVVPGNLCGASRENAVERSARALRQALQESDADSVELAIEPLRPIHTDFVNTLPQALELVAAVGDPRCGVCMDTYQVWRGEDARSEVLGEIAAAAASTRIVQVADSRPEPRSREDRLVPGEGVLPLVEMLAPVCSAGYDGWFAVEIMSTELWAGDYDELLERCHSGMDRILRASGAGS
jgi:sugar phosphate isomerase/epimerase